MWCENYVIKTVCYAGGLCLPFLRDLGYKVVNGVRWYLAVQTPREGHSSCAYASRVVNLRRIFLFVHVRCMWDLVLISLALYDMKMKIMVAAINPSKPIVSSALAVSISVLSLRINRDCFLKQLNCVMDVFSLRYGLNP
jgi:hypothetical protein